MKIWVDADACPVVIKEILFKAATRKKIELILVANHAMHIPLSKYISFVRVAAGFDVADNEIIRRLNSSDLVITSDIALAAEVLDLQAYALNPRGEFYTTETIQSQLTMRDFNDTLRASGIHTSGLATFNQRDKQVFANKLDTLLANI